MPRKSKDAVAVLAVYSARAMLTGKGHDHPVGVQLATLETPGLCVGIRCPHQILVSIVVEARMSDGSSLHRCGPLEGAPTFRTVGLRSTPTCRW